MEYKEQIKSPLWQRKRLEIMQRDNFTCCLCGATNKELNVHHLIYLKNKMIWEYDNELLVTLCGDDCHDSFHNELNKIIGLIAFKYLKEKMDLLEF